MKTFVTVSVLLGLLGATVGVAIWAWWQMGEVPISRHGIIALSLGALLSFVLGAGLMTLLFLSSRRGYDDRAHRGDEFHTHRRFNGHDDPV